MDLFVRESGSVGSPAIVFLHGGHLSGWTWAPVVERMLQYHCLVPDLPHFGRSLGQGPFEMSRSADAVAELIRSRISTGRAHLVGYSLGAQVGVQLLATEPKLINRAMLCGPAINPLPGVRLTQQVLGRLAGTVWLRRAVKRYWNSRDAQGVLANIDDYRRDIQMITGTRLVDIVVASAGFTLPEGLDKADAPTLFVTGAKEWSITRRSAATLARPMPNGSDRIAIGVGHDWPLRYPDLFAHTVHSWLSQRPLPAEIVQAGWRGERPAAR